MVVVGGRAGEIVSRDGVFTAQTNGLAQPWHGNVRRPKDKVGANRSLFLDGLVESPMLRQFPLPTDLAFSAASTGQGSAFGRFGRIGKLRTENRFSEWMKEIFHYGPFFFKKLVCA